MHLNCQQEKFKQRKIRANLVLSCAHPILCKQWKKLFEKIGIYVNRIKSNNHWSNINGLSTGKISNIKKLYNLGGFIEGVKISERGKCFGGIEKNALLEVVSKEIYFNNYNELIAYLTGSVSEK